ncbi:MAG: hypothetical protein F6K26_45825 [Moorea sp. SIO2I5]|nr:hypothetical protein [Moorena sp. SIO2I5]
MRYGTDYPNSGYRENGGKSVPNAPYATPDSRFPTPDSRLPTCSRIIYKNFLNML